MRCLALAQPTVNPIQTIFSFLLYNISQILTEQINIDGFLAHGNRATVGIFCMRGQETLIFSAQSVFLAYNMEILRGRITFRINSRRARKRNNLPHFSLFNVHCCALDIPSRAFCTLNWSTYLFCVLLLRLLQGGGRHLLTCNELLFVKVLNEGWMIDKLIDWNVERQE